MPYINGHTIKQLHTNNPVHRIDIVARKDGLFQFYIISIQNDEVETISYTSGLYYSAVATEDAARTHLTIADLP
jgi:hypothetical protein